MHYDIFKCEDYSRMTGTNAIEMMISDTAVDSHYTDFSISSACRTGTYASGFTKVNKLVQNVLKIKTQEQRSLNNKETRVNNLAY